MAYDKMYIHYSITDKSLYLEHFDALLLGIEKIIINGEESKESQKESNGRKEVPHVMVVKKVPKSKK